MRGQAAHKMTPKGVFSAYSEKTVLIVCTFVQTFVLAAVDK